MGVELIRKVCQDEVWGLTTPLVVKADGTKFGKTETGNVWLSASRTSPFALYQFFLNTPDAMVGAYLRYYTFLSHEEIEALDAETAERPQRRAGQRALARAVVVAGARRGGSGQMRGGLGGVVQRGDRRARARTCCWPSPRMRHRRISHDQSITEGLSLVDALERSGLAKSRGEARRTIQGGGAYVNNVRQSDVARRARARRPSARPLHRRAQGPTRRARPACGDRVTRRILTVVLLVLVAVGAASCAGEDQTGSAAHRYVVWVEGHRVSVRTSAR